MSDIIKDIEAYDNMRVKLESEHAGEWVLFFQEKLIGFYDTLEHAAEDAVQKFAEGPYLIRKIGAPPIILPASVVYQPFLINNA